MKKQRVAVRIFGIKPGWQKAWTGFIHQMNGRAKGKTLIAVVRQRKMWKFDNDQCDNYQQKDDL